MASGPGSSILLLAGRRFCARPIRPARKSACMRSWWTASKPCSASRRSRSRCWPVRSACARGSMWSKSCCTMPENSGATRPAAVGGREPVLRFGFPLGREEEAHAAAGHSAEHPEAPEILAHGGVRLPDERIRVQVPGPGNDGLDGTVEVAVRLRSDGADVLLIQPFQALVQNAEGLRR